MWITVVRADELVPGGHRVVEANGRQLAVYRLDDGYYAIEDVCTHDGGELAGGPVRGDQVECVRHGARFCIRTGAVVLGPAFLPVAVFPVRAENGLVQVWVSENSE